MREEDNYFLILKLVVDIGTDVLRNFCRKKLENMGQGQVQYIQHELLKSRMVRRMDKSVFQNMGIDKMDLSLLCIFVNAIEFGTTNPISQSQVISAVDTIRNIRNQLVHSTSTQIDERYFHELWDKTCKALVQIGGAEIQLVADDLLRSSHHVGQTKEEVHKSNALLHILKDVLLSRDRYEDVLKYRSQILNQIDVTAGNVTAGETDRVESEDDRVDNEDGRSYRRGMDVAIPTGKLKLLFDLEAYVAVGFIYIENLDATGTGFSIGGGFVMTAFHVFEKHFENILDKIYTYTRLYSNNTSAWNLPEWETLTKIAGLEKQEKEKIYRKDTRGRLGEVIRLWQGKRGYDLPLSEIIKAFKRMGLTQLADAVTAFLDKVWKAYIIFGYINSKILSDPNCRRYFHYDVAYANKEKDILILEIYQEDDKIDVCKNLLLKAKLDQELEVNILGHPSRKVQLFDAQCELLTDVKLKKERKLAENWCRRIFPNCVPDYNERVINLEDGNVFFHCSKTMERGASGSPCISFEKELASPVAQAMFLEGHPEFYYGHHRLTAEEKKNVPPCYLFEKAISTEFVYEVLQQDQFKGNRRYTIGYNQSQQTYMLFLKDNPRFRETKKSGDTTDGTLFVRYVLPALLTLLLIVVMPVFGLE